MQTANSYHSDHFRKKSGFILAIVLVAGFFLVILATAIYFLTSSNRVNISRILNGEKAHLAAEAALSFAIADLRKEIIKIGEGRANQNLLELLLQPGAIENKEITGYISFDKMDSLNRHFRQHDPDTSTAIKIYIEQLHLTETDPSRWNDPAVKKGLIKIEAKARCKGSERSISVIRSINVANILPGPLSKFTFFMKKNKENSQGQFNLIKNDYQGDNTNGPRPLILYNHRLPEHGADLNEILSEEKKIDIWQKRGWVSLSDSTTVLNLCSGAGKYGEVFQFYEIKNTLDFQPVKFETPKSDLPPKFSQTLTLPWDKAHQSIKMMDYNFSHHYVLDGFHDKSSRKNTNAMYEGNILSSDEMNRYGSASSILHLYGDTRLGYQSRTKVFGRVYSAFIRFANLEVEPTDSFLKSTLNSVSPPPVYLLPSKSPFEYTPALDITEFLNRTIGGPILKAGNLFNSYKEYMNFMSRIIMQPYNTSYNIMQDVYNRTYPRTFPTRTSIVPDFPNRNITLSKNDFTYFSGIPSLEGTAELMKSRATHKVKTIADFKEKFFNNNNDLELNEILIIENLENKTLYLPPDSTSGTMRVKAGGAIILERGQLVLGGIKMENPSDSLTLVKMSPGTIAFTSSSPVQANIIAPNSSLGYTSYFSLHGTLGIETVIPENNFRGGEICFNCDQDPTQEGYEKYYRIYLGKNDSYYIK